MKKLIPILFVLGFVVSGFCQQEQQSPAKAEPVKKTSPVANAKTLKKKGTVTSADSVKGKKVQPVPPYEIKGNTVIFYFVPKQYLLMHHGITGQEGFFKPDKDNKIYVSGEFNNWSTTAWPMEKTPQGIYILIKQTSECKGTGRHQFKYVVDSVWWVEPAVIFKNGIVSVGDSVGSRNYLLIIP